MRTRSHTMAAINTPQTLLDVPECVLVEQVYGRLGVKDRSSLSLTCKRLRKVAQDGAVFSDTRIWKLRVDSVRDDEGHRSERINDKTFSAAQLFRAENVLSENEAHAQLFLERYSELPPEEKWAVLACSLKCTSEMLSQSALTTPLGTVLPALRCLLVFARSGIQVDAQQVFAGLTNCTQLVLHTITEQLPEHPMQVHAGIFSHMPRLRILNLKGANITDIPPATTAPVLANLRWLIIHQRAPAQALLEQLAPHLPPERLDVWGMVQASTIPPGVFGLVGLKSLTFLICEGPSDIQGVTQLTNLTRLQVGFAQPGTVGPHIGLMTHLRHLCLWGHNGDPILVPRAIEQLSLLTELMLCYAHAGDEGLDLSRLRALRRLDATGSTLNIDNTTISAGNFPHLEELCFVARGPMPPAAFRPGLAKLNVDRVRGPLPLTSALAPTLNLTDLELTVYDHPELPEALGQVLTLTRLYVSGDALETLPLSLPNLVNLEDLEIKCTNITSMPPLGALTKLKVLDIFNNDLTALPDWVTALPLLEAINISGNLMRTLRWADLRMLPLCTHIDEHRQKGTRYATGTEPRRTGRSGAQTACSHRPNRRLW